MKCLDCGKDCLSLKKYIFHIGYVHKKCNYFLCPINNCKRLYHRKADFKKHVLQKHQNSNSTLGSGNNMSSKNTENTTSKENTNFAENIRSEPRNTDEVVANTIDSVCTTIQKKLNTFRCLFNLSLSSLISKLYDYLSVNRSVIQNVINDFGLFLSSGLLTIIKESFKVLTEPLDDKMPLNDINAMLATIEHPFISLNTEFKRLQYFEQCRYLIKPCEYKLGVSQERHRKDGEVMLQLKNSFSYYVPMDQTLKLFLEIPEVFKTITDYQNKLLINYNLGEPLYNVVNGSLWQRNQNRKKNTLPIVLYFDDFESGNPLGSHAGNYKVGAVYFSILTIPPIYSTRLENIFLCYLFYSSDRNLYGNEILFDVLIKQIKNLEDSGIIINVDNSEQKVYFELICITGDNLGLHGIFGLNESFSSHYFCRFCTALKQDTCSQIYEDEILIRRKDDYEKHLSDRVGVKESCVWHQLEKFHIYDNLVCDIMHDIYEGILRYDMAAIINALITDKSLSLQHLNSRIKYFTYAKFEKNIPPPIKSEHLKQGYIIMSAAEMLCLTQNFRFMVGDLIQTQNMIWQFYLNLLEIIDILTFPIISQHSLKLLQKLVSEHHEMYINIFKTTLKPKHHFLLHYSRIIEKIGPPSLLSCMRFEAKHKDLKNICYNSRNRKNLPYSIALRVQLKTCYRLSAGRGFNDNINYGLPVNVSNTGFFKNILTDLNPDDYCEVSWYENNGVKYDFESVLLCSSNETTNFPQLGKIINIFLNKNNHKNAVFVCRILEILEYSIHFKAYKVSDNMDCITSIQMKENCSETPTILHRVNNDLYVALSSN